MNLISRYKIESSPQQEVHTACGGKPDQGSPESNLPLQFGAGHSTYLPHSLDFTACIRSSACVRHAVNVRQACHSSTLRDLDALSCRIRCQVSRNISATFSLYDSRATSSRPVFMPRVGRACPETPDSLPSTSSSPSLPSISSQDRLLRSLSENSNDHDSDTPDGPAEGGGVGNAFLSSASRPWIYALLVR